jgi:hypothetical protein
MHFRVQFQEHPANLHVGLYRLDLQLQIEMYGAAAWAIRSGNCAGESGKLLGIPDAAWAIDSSVRKARFWAVNRRSQRGIESI